MIDNLNRSAVLGTLSFSIFFYLPFAKRDDEKKKMKKTSENIWKIYLKVLTFATAFRKESQFHQ